MYKVNLNRYSDYVKLIFHFNHQKLIVNGFFLRNNFSKYNFIIVNIDSNWIGCLQIRGISYWQLSKWLPKAKYIHNEWSIDCN